MWVFPQIFDWNKSLATFEPRHLLLVAGGQAGIVLGRAVEAVGRCYPGLQDGHRTFSQLEQNVPAVVQAECEEVGIGGCPVLDK